ncbi:ABC transporter permease [Clostridium carboxidivorans P7]|uniref:Binding-protein-dependent transport systems inner membrane component n=1 Tax=Clostridium carboxidivorans P7 TaxID=536227 RepID=C6PW40_9CLOT|nr:ABC transporter permease [Clostridium carboxidivorans]AKN30084.1 ABC transporter permease [Clostridium carboxidivorans P7]EET86519.1 binding-protein-dependent transport systems inner membrane component [Clostridium carboxidivorans P7]EFG89092.1 putative spermidine/putrescine transport system permease protein PotB [Clostridium carboxidivorans P7]
MKKRYLLMSPALFILIAFGIVPLFIMLYFSFLSDGQTASFTLKNYIDFFSKGLYIKLTVKTIKISLIVTSSCLLVAYPMAYIMAKIVRKGKGIMLLLIIIPFWTSELVRAYSWVNLLRDGGILEIFLRKLHIIGGGNLGILFTQAAVIIGLTHIFFPYMVITIYMSLEKLDDSIIEASKSLGATSFNTFKNITLPLSKVGILTGAILVFVPCLGSFVEPRILGGVNGSVIGTIIEDQFFEIYGWNFGAAIAFILLALVLVSLGIFSKFNREV